MEEDFPLRPYSCGDLVAEQVDSYRQTFNRNFFEDYVTAIRNNRRFDQRQDSPSSLIVHEDEHTILFVPKSQTSQWELQLMTLPPVGNILEADSKTRESLDRAILLSMKILTGLGGRLITTIEFAKPLDKMNQEQCLLYSFLPKLPQSMGAFSEAQYRYIMGHYPEDFAEACRKKLSSL